ncbi:SLC13 family permease, partial [uncultured Abyssibacter sp.]|uniref:SLC13 family permease n=1 Tax=uncultured Abyssibacter sp. TaxID=2320202 RepID=UPI0032B26978
MSPSTPADQTSPISLWPLAAGVIGALVAAMLTVSAGLSASAAWTAGVTALCAIWWATEAIPLPATALIPIGVFPLVGVLDAEAVASAYGSQLILLFLGGFLLSKAMECSGAHRRIALQLVNWVGGSPRRLVFAFLLAAGALSMW